VRILRSYLAHLRKGAVSAGPRGGFTWGKREHAKVLLPAIGLVLVAAYFGGSSTLGILLLIVAAVLALIGTVLIIYVSARYDIRAHDKRYNMFIRKKLSAEYRKDRR
jgi:hypothetical protein